MFWKENELSRKIDLSDPSKLSDADKIYLQQRNRLPQGVEPVEIPTADAGIGPMTKPEPEPVNQPVVAGEGVDYSQWNVERLKAELSSRELSVTGNKAELVKRLEEDDASEDGEELDEDEDEDDEDNN